MKAMMVLVAAVALSGCGVEVAGQKLFGGDSNKENKTEALSYEYSYNGCNTGRHEFPSQEAYCNGLKDDALNKYCAISIRYDDFKRNCGTMSWN